MRLTQRLGWTVLLGAFVPLAGDARVEFGHRVDVGKPSAQGASHAGVAVRMSTLPLRFEANAGQWSPHARFRAHQGGATLFVTDEGMTIGLTEVKPTPHTPGQTLEQERAAREEALKNAKSAAVAIKLEGARPSAPRGEQEIVTKSNFFLGNDPATWRTNVPNYAQVRAKGWLPGVDVVWHGSASGLEYDLDVAAGVDARKIEFTVEGAHSLRVNDDGALEIATAAGTLVQRPPRVVQDGRELVARYRVVGRQGITLALEAYDPSSAVLVDPVLTYSTYLGGSGDDQGNAIAVDSSGNAYLTGTGGGLGFPITTGAFESVSTGAYVTKLNATASALVYSTYIGGTGGEQGYGITVDSSGNAYVTGMTSSTDFPTTAGALKTTTTGGSYSDAFVTKFNATGSALIYSTYLGGTLSEAGNGIALDSSGNAYVTGYTTGAYPTYTTGAFPTTSGAFQTTFGGYRDAFVAKINPTGSALAYASYLGGSGSDTASGIAVDSSGNAYVTGNTAGSFPTTPGAYETTYGGGQDDGFLVKVNATGSALSYSTYLGGSGNDAGYGIALDSSGNAYVTGFTTGSFPTTTGAYQTTFGGGWDAIVGKLNPAGSALVYSTYLGGSGNDAGYGIALDSNGDAYVTGYTTGSFPTTAGAFHTTYGASQNDAFATKLDAAGATLVYSTYLGAGSYAVGKGLVLDSNSNAYITGQASNSFPTTAGAYQTVYGGGLEDSFVAKISDPELANGASCTQAGACASAHCVDGVCCDQACAGQCEACDVTNHVGTCSPVSGVPHGSRAACVGTGTCASTCDGLNTSACTYPGTSTICGATTCAGGVETDNVCDGAGGCTSQATHACDSYGCSSNGLTCDTTCSTDADCAAGYFCQGTACVSQNAQGSACARDPQCTSGRCVDGFCCDTACSGQCEACDVGGSAGTCTPVSGAPHGSRSVCGPSAACGFCDGTNPAACTFPGTTTSCASPTCGGSVETDYTCDGQGACVSATHSCNNLACTADGSQCKTTCTTDTDCVNGFVCTGGACVPAPTGTCTDDHTLKGADGTLKDCSPYKCGSGACKNPCTSVDDCLAPNVCDPNQQCVPPPSSGDSGCSCDTSSRASPPWGTGLLVVAVASVLTRRRRRSGPPSAGRHSPGGEGPKGSVSS